MKIKVHRKDAHKKYCNHPQIVKKHNLEKYIINNQTIEVLIEECVCKICGEPIFDYNIEEKNILKVYNNFREKNHLLSSNKIIEIRKQKNMTQKDFAKKLGICENDVIRYENGALQPFDIDEKIKKL